MNISLVKKTSVDMRKTSYSTYLAVAVAEKKYQGRQYIGPPLDKNSLGWDHNIFLGVVRSVQIVVHPYSPGVLVSWCYGKYSCLVLIDGH